MNYYNELYHYGVLGMKWGVRHYQDKNGRLTSAGKERYGNKSKSNSNKIAKGSKFVDSAAEQKISGSMAGMNQDVSDFLVKTSALAVTAITLAAVQAVKAKKIEKQLTKQYMNEIEDKYKKREPKSLAELPKLNRQMSLKDSIKLTNPGCPKEEGTTMNCTFCTTSLAMREKGFDVIAKRTDHGYPTKELFAKVFKGAECTDIKTKNGTALFNTLAKQGDKAYGNLDFEWKTGGRHSVFYKIENGQTHVYDGQNGREYDANEFNKHVNTKSAKCIRLDNCEPTDYAIAITKPRE